MTRKRKYAVRGRQATVYGQVKEKSSEQRAAISEKQKQTQRLNTQYARHKSQERKVMELLKLLSMNEIIAQVISFLLLFFLLRVFAWKKILTLLDERRERIAAEFRGIEEVKAELAKIKADYEAQLAAIDETAAKKIQAATAAAKQVSEDIRKQAHGEAERIIRGGRESAQFELSKAKEVLKQEIVDLVIKTVKGIIGENLTGDQDKRMIENFLQQIDKAE